MDTTAQGFDAAIAARIAECAGEDSSLRLFAELLFEGTDKAIVDGISDAQFKALIHQAYNFHSSKDAGAHKISVRRVEGIGPDGDDRTVVEIANDDMPFLLVSAMAELQGRGHRPILVQHPILKVERTPAGERVDIVARGDGNWGDGLQESFILAIIEPLTDAAASDLRNALDDVMREVRFAVTDWQRMAKRLAEAMAALERGPSRTAPGALAESLAFCQWLIDGQFTFLGVREYRLEGDTETGKLVPVADSGLGVLRDPAVQVLSKGGGPLELTPESRRHVFSAQPLIITKSDILSRVHRRTYMDYVGLKTYGADGAQTGELRLVGLFTAQAYTAPPTQIPFLRQKVDAVLRQTGFAPGSHDAKALLNVLEQFPRDELFRIGDKMLAQWARGILDLDLRPRVRLLARRDRFDRFVSGLVYVPRERFSTAIRAEIGDALMRAYRGHVSAFTPFFPEGNLIRIHYIIGRDPSQPPGEVDEAALEAEINDIARMWVDRLGARLAAGGPDMRRLASKYVRAFSPAYAETFAVDRALEDIRRIERLGESRPVAVDFYQQADGAADQLHATVYRFDEPIPLSERVPVLENFGFLSIDERSYRLTPAFEHGIRPVSLHDMLLETCNGAPPRLDLHDDRLEDGFIAVNQGVADNDPFNRLIIVAGADWRAVAMLRAYAAYMRQIRSPYGMRYVSDTLVTYGDIARHLIDLFACRFDPDVVMDEAARAARQTEITSQIEAALEAVPSLDEDRILRTLTALVLATKRTNFYRDEARKGLPETIAFKLAPQELDMVPAPRPLREIWVYSPRVEGVHLRFGPIARGGIRWSDRAQDFRTEVLGLCKAQQVKNTVIVPEGSKGGFFPKRLPREGGREAVMAEAVGAYRVFISALLEITDNLVDGQTVPPDRVVRHDGDDPYLVVAADKGTATFSDFANEISTDSGFWLGDAFASGGSAGYDHKKMGITARGAWECVKRHFREMDVDIQATPFTVIGVGDMSGDVFGNGMLLSTQTRLLAAFDHRDIFIDPDPDLATSFAERKRLFDLGRSSWQDYDRSKISSGGGVFRRDAKSVALSDEIRQLLGIEAKAVPPTELMNAILKAEADLLWFGGIGTYVRAAHETDADVGDRANDAIRVTADELRVKVVGEGANLGATQAARIAFAQRGGRINTDFIDNSAGVNSSDKEVNIKIALGAPVRDGRLDQPSRNALLARMTDDVAADCLWNNYQQGLAISLAERRGPRDVTLLARLMRQLEERGLVHRKLEGLPTEEAIAARLSAGQGFSRPEIAVLMSWAKIALAAELMQSTVADDPANEQLLIEYFPTALREQYRADLIGHPLRREIIVTRITNSMINRAGPAMLVRLKDATGRETAEIASSFLATRTVYDLPAIWADIDALDTKVAGSVQLQLYARTQGVLLDQTAELLRLAGSRSVSDLVSAFAPGVSGIAAEIASVLTPAQADRMRAETEGYIAAGVPPELANRIAGFEPLRFAPTAVKLAEATGAETVEAARVMFGTLDFFRFGEIRARAEALQVSDYYDRLALSGAFGTLRSASRALARDILLSSDGAKADVQAWVAANGAGVRAARRQVDDIVGAGELTISRLTVAASQIRELTSEG